MITFCNDNLRRLELGVKLLLGADFNDICHPAIGVDFLKLVQQQYAGTIARAMLLAC